jgi:flavin-dependent dehydrogenase
MQHVGVVIIGGGLAGLICAIQLKRQDLEVALIEKKEYPFHRVCGEYISNEVTPFLERLGVYPSQFNPPKINQLHISSVGGHQATMELPLGGFGISRYQFDHFLYQYAKDLGVQFITRKSVQSVDFKKGQFEITLNDQQKLHSTITIGAFGKRSVLDKSLARPFMKKRSPYLAVKYHAKGQFPRNRISLHNFPGGYAGLSCVEDEKLNLCYLAPREALKELGTIERLEAKLLSKNPFLKQAFNDLEFQFEQPLVINEVSFASKLPVERHILMCGDAAGMITPLCGNGMAMAIHSSSILSPLITKFFNKPYYQRDELERDYALNWNDHFKQRLWTGRRLQKLFGGKWASAFAVNLVRNAAPFAQYLVRKTHGEVF